MTKTAWGEDPPKPRDPFNWPALNRRDTVSATGGLDQRTDLFHMTTQNLRCRSRKESTNLHNDDIEGKSPATSRPWSLLVSIHASSERPRQKGNRCVLFRSAASHLGQADEPARVQPRER